MAQDVKRAAQYVAQALGRYAELRDLLGAAKQGTGDWGAIAGVSRSLEANLASAAADLVPTPAE